MNAVNIQVHNRYRFYLVSGETLDVRTPYSMDQLAQAIAGGTLMKLLVERSPLPPRDILIGSPHIAAVEALPLVAGGH